MLVEIADSPVLATAKGKTRDAPNARYTINTTWGLPVRVIAASSWPKQALIQVTLIW